MTVCGGDDCAVKYGTIRPGVSRRAEYLNRFFRGIALLRLYILHRVSIILNSSPENLNTQTGSLYHTSAAGTTARLERTK